MAEPELVNSMSEIDGVETLASSQGGQRGLAYVTFQGANASKFAMAMPDLMAQALASGEGSYISVGGVIKSEKVEWRNLPVQ